MTNQTLQSFGIQSGSGGGSATDAQRVIATAKNKSGGTLLKGTPVHAITPISSGQIVEVIAARADTPSAMPATLVLDVELDDEEEGDAIIVGFIQGVDTSGFTAGDVVYVGTTGGYTKTKPVYPNLIQNIGVIVKVSASAGSGIVYGSGRSNDVPNLAEGTLFIGSSTNTTTTPYRFPTSSPSDNQFLLYDSSSTAFLASDLKPRMSYFMGGTITGWGIGAKLVMNKTPNGSLLSSSVASPVLSTTSDLTEYTIPNLDDSLQTTIRFSGFVTCEGTIASSITFRVDIGLSTPSNGATSATFTMTNGTSQFAVSTTSGAMNFFNYTASFTSVSNQLIIVSLANTSAITAITSGDVKINARVDIEQNYTS